MARNASLNVSLTPTLNAFVRESVKTGQYESASELIRDSLRFLQEHRHEANGFWSQMRKKVRSGKQTDLSTDSTTKQNLSEMREAIKQRIAKRKPADARAIEASIKAYYQRNHREELTLCREWDQQDSSWPQ
jgi:antitoxin ParD1/3/4